ncbi:MAG: NAD+ synthase [Bacteroidota bacterium]
MSLVVRMVTLNPTVGAIEENQNLIIQSYNQAVEDEVDLLVLPEMTITGYPPMDLLYHSAFMDRVKIGIEKLIEATKGHQTGLLFGAPTVRSESIGRPLYNSAILASEGRQVAVRHKMLLPNYDVFDEARYFEAADQNKPVNFQGVSLGVTICEDIWWNSDEHQYYTYDRHPSMELKKAGAELLVNLSASPFTKTKSEARRKMLSDRAQEVQLPICYANQSGGNTELVFDGEAYAVQPDGTIVGRTPLFEETSCTVSYDVATRKLRATDETTTIPKLPSHSRRHFEALSLGLRDYLAKTGISNSVILGLSGGIDSAVVATLAAEALGAENVHTITMPSEFSSPGSISDSQQLADNFGIKLYELPIKSLYEEYLTVLNPLFKDTKFGVAEENLQSRARGMLLMAMSNKYGHMLLNTGNKSEIAVGYCTLYGDMNGGLSVIGDLYKTEVYDLARWLNEHYYQQEMIPNTIIEKAPSAELRPDQKDEDSLPSYEILDQILQLYLERGADKSDIIATGIDKSIVDKVLRLVDFTEYKRNQAPPILKVSDKAFGSGRRWPIVQRWTQER